MLYRCYNCKNYSFENTCPSCLDASIDDYVPLDPKYYPEFQYKTQGVVKDLLFKKQEQQQLNQKLESVLNKYEQFKYPYFINYVHISRGNDYAVSNGQESAYYSNLGLFHMVLTRLGFVELNEFDMLTIKLIRSTEFTFDYANFATQINNTFANQGEEDSTLTE